VNCPHGHGTLLMSERQGIEIDYCPECRGVWLDRGELDKIVERSTGDTESHAPEPRDTRDRDDDRRRDPEPVRERNENSSDDRERGRYESDPRYDPKLAKKKKRKSFLEDLFEF